MSDWLLTQTTALQHPADTLVVLDFETTGLSPRQGDRAIEIGAVRIEQGRVTERFQKLMNPGRRISYFIENYTGITNRMLAAAAPCEEVMAEFADFLGSDNLVAHNAAFDKNFLEAELFRLQRKVKGQFGCSMLLSRRLYPDAPSHKLSRLVAYKQIPNQGVFHRALADSEMTAQLWLRMLEDLQALHPGLELSFGLTLQLMKTPKREVGRLLAQQANRFSN